MHNGHEILLGERPITDFGVWKLQEPFEISHWLSSFGVFAQPPPIADVHENIIM